MVVREIADSTLIRDYVCGKCFSPLTIRWREGEGSSVECLACGRRGDFVRKATIEHYEDVRAPGRYALVHNPIFSRFLPDDMRPDVPDAKISLEELFGA